MRKKVVHLRCFGAQKRYSFAFLSKIKGFSLVEMLMALLVASLLLAALAPVITRRVADNEIKYISETTQYEKNSIITVYSTAVDEEQEFNIPSDVNKVTVTMMGGGGAGGDANWGSMIITNSQAVTLPEGVDKIRVFMIGAGGGGAAGGVGIGKSYGATPALKIASKDVSITTPGEYKLSDYITVPSTYIAPALNKICTDSGSTDWIVADDEAFRVAPGKIIPRYPDGTGINFTKLYACGGGGGGGGWAFSTFTSGGGGSGGYIANTSFNTTAAASNIYIKVGGGGGAGGGGGTAAAEGGDGGYSAGGGGGGVNGEDSNSGGAGGTYGGAGGASGAIAAGKTGGNGKGTVFTNGGKRGSNGVYVSGNGGRGSYWGGGGGGGGSPSRADAYGTGGGGGGGPTTISTAAGITGTILFQVGGGGGGGGGGDFEDNGTDSFYGAGGAGGGGGGYGGGGGGGGGGYKAGGGATAGADSLNEIIGIGKGQNGLAGTKGETPHGGGGGGGFGGVSGGTAGTTNKGIISNVFGSSHCNGGEGSATGDGASGSPGAIKFTVSADIPVVNNALYCEYNQPANGGGGGGGGEVTVGEVNIGSNRNLYFEVGGGGKGGQTPGSNGNAGGKTAIYIGDNNSGTELISAKGGLAGEYSGTSTNIGGAFGAGQGSSIKGKNWTSKTFIGGQNGTNGYAADSNGTTIATGGNGGIGGNSQFYDIVDKEIVTTYGGIGGGSPNKVGGSPDLNAQNTNGIFYGAGGGGGAGAKNVGDTSGLGGDGGNGYIYIEWGGSNGGGGTVGEFIQKTFINLDSADRKMYIKIGKGGDNTTEDGNGGITSVRAKSGGKMVTFSARGGIRGDNGHADTGVNGNKTLYPSIYERYYEDFVQTNISIILGQEGEHSYGGIGGYLACIYNSIDEEENKICAKSVKSNDGMNVKAGPVRPGCGGTTLTAPLYEEICVPYTVNANANGGNGEFGGGGGGGAVLNSTKGKGGKGGDGFVILEYKSVQ